MQILNKKKAVEIKVDVHSFYNLFQSPRCPCYGSHFVMQFKGVYCTFRIGMAFYPEPKIQTGTDPKIQVRARVHVKVPIESFFWTRGFRFGSESYARPARVPEVPANNCIYQVYLSDRVYFWYFRFFLKVLGSGFRV